MERQRICDPPPVSVGVQMTPGGAVTSTLVHVITALINQEASSQAAAVGLADSSHPFIKWTDFSVILHFSLICHYLRREDVGLILLYIVHMSPLHSLDNTVHLYKSHLIYGLSPCIRSLNAACYLH